MRMAGGGEGGKFLPGREGSQEGEGGREGGGWRVCWPAGRAADSRQLQEQGGWVGDRQGGSSFAPWVGPAKQPGGGPGAKLQGTLGGQKKGKK